MKRLLRDVVKTAVTSSTYPAPVRLLLNWSPAPVHIEAAENVDIQRGCVLHGDVHLERGVGVGEGSILSGNVTVRERGNLVRENELIGDVEIGKYCAVGPKTSFQQRNHVTNRPGIQFKMYRDVLGTELGHDDADPIIVGNDVWFGRNVTVLPGVSIGHGAIIGAGSIVTQDVEPYETVAGVPAERIGWRFSESTREELLDIKWWNWSDEKLRSNREFFETDLTAVDSISDLLNA